MLEIQRLRKKRAEILSIAHKYGIENIRVFGSVARGEDNPQSDIDFLVTVKPESSLLDLGGAVIKLQELLERKVDIVTENGLHWYVKKKILSEAQTL